MRGTVDTLEPPVAIGEHLPGLFQEDDLVVRFTEGLDVVLAPVLDTLDSFDAYLDARLAPTDFLPWLAGWVGVDLDASWDEGRRRDLVARAAGVLGRRGTVRGVAEAVAMYTGVWPEIEESGGVSWTTEAAPAGDLPGSPQLWLVVTVALPAGSTVDPARLDRIVASAKPAHVPHRVDIVPAGAPVARPAPPPPSQAPGAKKRPPAKRPPAKAPPPTKAPPSAARRGPEAGGTAAPPAKPGGDDGPDKPAKLSKQAREAKEAKDAATERPGTRADDQPGVVEDPPPDRGGA